MIEFYFWPTPNGWKISIALEEMQLPYEVVPVNIGRGEQFTPEFQSISPSNRMPAIVDRDPDDGGEPLALAESGVILRYLAEKSGNFFPRDRRQRYAAEQWLMWQMSQLGPMLGQHGHFALYARERIPYAVDRYRRETLRLFKELDRRLADREYICDDFTIVDMACWPWILTYKSQQIDLAEFPNVRRWYDNLKTRPGLRRGYDLLKDHRSRRGSEAPDEEARVHLFGQSGAATNKTR
ncbi:MAG: glutathione S-transferase N-terminal domain-containing protein [Gammaproteobacteria bacterium]|nr:glutathione S-transferase N-terminal domain-containing protein [Gammaproteobacteria bacterium]